MGVRLILAKFFNSGMKKTQL